MGMDVIGKKPKTEQGAYFRANVWSWRPIHALIEIANLRSGDRLISRDTMLLMCSNDGAGLKSQKDCNALANALERLLEKPCLITEHGLEIVEEKGERFIAFPINGSPMMCDKEGRFWKSEDVRAGKVKREDLRSPYETGFGHMREFIVFLRNCGGFEVC